MYLEFIKTKQVKLIYVLYVLKLCIHLTFNFLDYLGGTLVWESEMPGNSKCPFLDFWKNKFTIQVSTPDFYIIMTAIRNKNKIQLSIQ